MRHIDTAMLIAALLAAPLLAVSAGASAELSVGISVAVGPPPLPDYDQPNSPGDDYLWTPGYWAYDSGDYYWVPGTWVVAPAVGLLWTPGYWGWREGAYWWNAGYWDTRVGFYGGVDYGYGYGGAGYSGGYWRGNAFHRDRSMLTDNHVVRASFNGGTGGINVRATASDEAFARGRHTQATSDQQQHEHAARDNPAQRFAQNHGRPVIAGTPRPGKFGGSDVVSSNPTRDASVHNPVVRNLATDQRATHTPPANNSVARGRFTHGPAAANPVTQDQAHIARSHTDQQAVSRAPPARGQSSRDAAPAHAPQMQRGQQHAGQAPAHAPPPTQKRDEQRHPPV